VIQRVGRINRINKKMFDRLYIYNYFPTNVGEGETRTKEITTLKMAMINAIIGEDTKVLTSDIELRSYFVDQYRNMMAENEAENWETKYRQLLNRVKGTLEHKTALAIPHRSRVGRTVVKTNGVLANGVSRDGVLLFGRKKDTCIFKLSKDLLDVEMLAPEDAFTLLEADIIEEPKKVSADFDAIYQNIKQSLFTSTVTEKTDKTKREVLDKLNAIANTGKFDTNYLKDLQYAAEIGALSGHSLQFIRQLKPSEYAILPKEI
jgi:DNA-binding ferritin-like protein (Dps family)